jgi:hypothetical protein
MCTLLAPSVTTRTVPQSLTFVLGTLCALAVACWWTRNDSLCRRATTLVAISLTLLADRWVRTSANTIATSVWRSVLAVSSIATHHVAPNGARRGASGASRSGRCGRRRTMLKRRYRLRQRANNCRSTRICRATIWIYSCQEGLQRTLGMFSIRSYFVPHRATGAVCLPSKCVPAGEENMKAKVAASRIGDPFGEAVM